MRFSELIFRGYAEMTLAEMAKAVYKHSVGHVLNGQKMKEADMHYWFKRMLNGKKSVVFTMQFPDGEWLCEAVHEDWGYDYIVPDTREEEAKILQKFLQK